MKEYKSILFDLDMTLLDFDSGEFNALKKTFAKYGVEIDEALHGVYSQINKSLWKRLEKGEIDKAQLSLLRFPTFIKEIGLDLDGIKIDKEYKDNLSYEAIVIDGVRETCRALYEKYNLYIITNGTDYIQRRRIALSSLESLFRRIVTSDEAGSPKPKREFFDFFFEKTGEDRQYSLIVGDSLTSDIMGGINYGIDTCLVGQADQSSEIKPTYLISNIAELLNIL